ncbi:STAS domain-containing protein [Desulfonema magnum]|uniref:STAS domain-containing protein n=1 Tax=Desulfonema magnum TaxID=45655 RepID=A0A975BS77_9BACT|nr:STAS domain-containing protein [Desulfonema magnum]QTA90681.1 STAS domain-containing protein [Desulfonema magnum]
MEISVAYKEERVCFTVKGKIGDQGAEVLMSRFFELDKSSFREVIFDFRAVSNIGSKGIGKLLLFYKDLAASGASMRVENVSDTLYDLFSVLKLDTIFPITKA